MKYQRLSREQFEELHQEFITFLATQSITAEEWEAIKTKQPEVAEEELDIFSDLVWEKVLKQASYLESIAPQQLFLFKISEEKIHLILVKVNHDAVDLSNTEGLNWLETHLKDPAVELFTSEKPFGSDPLLDIFKLIQQGATLSDGQRYEAMANLIAQ